MKKKFHTPIFYVLMSVLAGVFVSGCAMMSPSRQFSAQMLNEFPSLKRVAEIENVPFIAQEDKYCGPAALAMLSSWGGLAVDQQGAADLVYTPGREGTLQNDMVTGMRRLGFLTIQTNRPEAVFTQISDGRPVIVFLNLGLSIRPVWHYAVLKGYDLDKRTVTLHSGVNENETMSLDTFLHTWKRTDYWGLIAAQPVKIPPGVTAVEVQQAIFALEQVNMMWQAKDFYKAALAVWPRDYGLHMGYANFAYAQKDYKSAEQHFIMAWKNHPKMHAPLNNLTYALIAQKCYTNAIHAAREALWLAPEKDKPAVQQTLDEALLHHGKPESRTCAKLPVIR